MTFVFPVVYPTTPNYKQPIVNLDQPVKTTATITMSAPVLHRLRETAKSEKRSLSQQIELLVERHFGITPTRKASKKEVASV